ncbi:hypothetical protein J6590_106466, partial [Homalodisca vitripennis]
NLTIQLGERSVTTFKRQSRRKLCDRWLAGACSAFSPRSRPPLSSEYQDTTDPTCLSGSLMSLHVY